MSDAPARKLPHIRWIWRLWRERGGLILLLFVLTLLSSAVAVAYPLLSKLLLDLIQGSLARGEGGGAAKAEIDRLVLLILTVGIAGFLASFFPGIRGAVNNVFEHLIRSKFFAAVMAKDHRFFSAFRSGDIVTRLTEDIYDAPKLSWFLCSGIFRAVESISKVAFCLVTMLFLDWRLTLLSMIPLPLMIGIFIFAQDRIYDSFKRNQEAISDINSQLEMSFSGVRIIKAYACEAKYERFFGDALARRFGTEMGVVRIETLLQLVYQYIDYFAQIGVVFAGGWMAVKGDISIGTFYAFYSYLGMLVYPILDIPNLFVSSKRAFVNIDRLEEMRTWKSHSPARVPTGDSMAAEAIATDAMPTSHAAARETRTLGRIESLEFSGVSFRHQGREEDALAGVTLSLGRGERLVVVGPVGSGKTTLLRLMAGLCEPTGGRIMLNGEELSDVSPASLTAEIGYVPQESLLFTGTIRENIAFGAPGAGLEIDDADYASATEMAQIADEIAAFSEGEKTLLGQRGASLSGGQRQRLAIARAVARKPSLLLFDDITASLDASNEERLWKALADWSADLTSVVVSHRVSTLAFADRVLYLSEGRVRAFGRHEDLLLANQDYRDFIDEHFARERN